MEQLIDNHPKQKISKPRNGFTAFFLSLILPGLGQIYNGQPKKGIIFFGLLLLIPFLFGMTRATTFFYGMFTLFIIEVFLRIYIIIDSIVYARRQRVYVQKSYNTWYYHLLIAVGMIAILTVYDLNAVLGTQSFKIPSLSNNPTFQSGDFILADTRAYQNKKPEYGDLVVFSRSDGNTYTYRIVGLPNDEIAVIDGVVSINGKLCKSRFVKKTKNNFGMRVEEFEEMLPNGHTHLIYKCGSPYEDKIANFEKALIPADSYFLVGDNRDFSRDSRFDGFVSRGQIIGRMIYSYWGEAGSIRMNIDFRDK
jgi:signal peptidase I